jgi:hypothetical protein
MSFFDRFRKRKTGEDPERPGVGLPDPDEDWTPPGFVEAVKLMAADDSHMGYLQKTAGSTGLTPKVPWE